MRTGDYLQSLLIHDLGTFEHCVRVARNLRSVARFLELEPEIANQLVLAGLLHDIGKLKVSKEVLTGKEPLDDFGRGEIKKHPSAGRVIAQSIGTGSLIQELIVSHHEPGYPRTSTRVPDENSVLKQLVRLADKVDALKSRRSYKSEFSDSICKRLLLDEGFGEDLIDLLLVYYSKGSSV